MFRRGSRSTGRRKNTNQDERPEIGDEQGAQDDQFVLEQPPGAEVVRLDRRNRVPCHSIAGWSSIEEH